MRITIVAITADRPNGGAKTRYEYANVFARKGHEVFVIHLGSRHPITDRSQVDWFEFEPAVRHYTHSDTERVLNEHESDIIFGPYVARRFGLPVTMMQGHYMFDSTVEKKQLARPAALVCIAGWLARICRDIGIPQRRILHAPNGLDHRVFAMRRPLDDREFDVAMCYNRHPQKRCRQGIEVMNQVRKRRPGLRAVIFGTIPRPDHLPDWIEYRSDLRGRGLADAVYNKTRAFLCSSRVEGFGNTSLEAMACGAALVTTDNGGSEEYAAPDRTALVSPADDWDALAYNLDRVLGDDGLRASLSAQGRSRSLEFDWERSGSKIEAFLEKYFREPERYLEASPEVAPELMRILEGLGFPLWKLQRGRS